jgi:hypothetical protein
MALVLLAATASANWTFTDVSEHLMGLPSNVSSVAWGDVNGDGHPDLFVGSGTEESSALYLNLDGQFENVTELYGIDLCHANFIKKAQFIDFDQDGLLDLFFLRSDNLGVEVLKRTSPANFQVILPTSGPDQDRPIESAVWTDLNHDGSYELVISNDVVANTPLTVLANVGNDFVAMRDNPLPNDLRTVGALTTVDYDMNGTLDWFVGSVNSDGDPHLYRNISGEYEDWTTRFDIPAKSGVSGACWFDYNNDHQLDLFIPGDENTMRLYKGTPRFGVMGLEAVNATTLRPATNGEYAYPVDANMDGWTDLFITKRNGDGCVLLVNISGQYWQDMTTTLGLENLGVTNLACAFADYDGNGTPDLAIAQGTDGLRLYQNVTIIKQEYYQLNLMNSAGTPVPNCSIYMELENCKIVSTTATAVCAPGGSNSTITLISDAERKSNFGFIRVNWANGETVEYSTADLVRGGSTNLIQPTSFEVPVAVVKDMTPQMVVSPNPFNPTTMLSFTLPAAANVELRVYNTIGQEVALLTKGSFAEGTHRVGFNGANLPSGLYFARMTAGGNTAISRLLLSK